MTPAVDAKTATPKEYAVPRQLVLRAELLRSAEERGVAVLGAARTGRCFVDRTRHERESFVHLGDAAVDPRLEGVEGGA